MFFDLGGILGLFKHVTAVHPDRIKVHEQLQDTRSVRKQYPNNRQICIGKPMEPRRADIEQQLHCGHRVDQSEHVVLQQQEHQSPKLVEQSVRRSRQGPEHDVVQ